jgi:hypothetical protein
MPLPQMDHAYKKTATVARAKRDSPRTPAPVSLRVVLPPASAAGGDAARKQAEPEPPTSPHKSDDGDAARKQADPPTSLHKNDDGHRAGYPLSPLSKSRRAARERIAGSFLESLATQDPSLEHLVAAKHVIADALQDKLATGNSDKWPTALQALRDLQADLNKENSITPHNEGRSLA